MDSASLRLALLWRHRYWMGIAFALPLLPLGWALYGPRGATVHVTAKTWRMEIDVEQQALESGSDWCDALPAQAIEVSRRVVDGAAHCRYSAPQWRKRWVAKAEGEDPAAARWPEASLNATAQGEINAERMGRRQAFYELQLDEPDGRHWVCALPLAQWQRWAKGQSFRIRVDRFGVADCATVPVQ